MRTPPKQLTKLWKCPKCGRGFERRNQTHSCRFFPIEKHFKGKEDGRLLYEKLVEEIKTKAGPYKVESLACCIHLLSTFTFAAIRVFKNKLVIDFSLDHKIKSRRFLRSLRISAHRYLYYVEISKNEDIDAELMEWIKEAMIKKQKRTD